VIALAVTLLSCYITEYERVNCFQERVRKHRNEPSASAPAMQINFLSQEATELVNGALKNIHLTWDSFGLLHRFIIRVYCQVVYSKTMATLTMSHFVSKVIP